MIIWRGWGVLPILIAAACAGLGAVMSIGVPNLRGVFIGLCLIGGGVGTWFVGQHLNKTRPAAELDAWHAKRRAEIAALVQAGHYSKVPDPQRPGELAEPWSVGEYVLSQETARMRTALAGRHTLFFIPMQYIGFVLGAVGLLVIVTTIGR